MSNINKIQFQCSNTVIRDQNINKILKINLLKIKSPINKNNIVKSYSVKNRDSQVFNI